MGSLKSVSKAYMMKTVIQQVNFNRNECLRSIQQNKQNVLYFCSMVAH